MENPIIITVNLLGQISGMVKHTNKQRHTCQTSKGPISKVIKHSDRKEVECTRRTNISSEVVYFWTSDACPEWEDVRRWKKMNERQRLISHVVRFDEGYGVTFDIVK